MRKFLFYSLLTCLIFSSAAHAQTQTQWQNGDYIRARILSDQTMPNDAALDVQMMEGWHTYWQVPGDSGLPPSIDWAGSENIQNVELLYPFPRRLEEAGLVINGYKDKVSFPLHITRIDESTPAKLNLKLDMIVCQDICVPDGITLTSDLDGQSAALITRRQQALPYQGNIKALRIDTIVLGRDNLVFSAEAHNGFDQTEIIVVSEDYSFSGIPEITPDKNDPRKALIKIPATSDMDNVQEFLKGKDLRILFSDGRNAIEYTHSF